MRQNLHFPQSIELRILAVLGVGLLSVLGEELAKPQDEAVAETEDYVFKPLEIKSSPTDGIYVGRFLFINKGSAPVEISGFDEPIDGKMEPRFVSYQMRKDEKWSDIKQYHCGTGAIDFSMKPGTEYQLFVGLYAFEEQAAPLTGRIGVGRFRSEPFVLDWKKDRDEGKFAQARADNLAEARAGFVKAGFKKELLQGDDFCERIISSMMKETAAKDMAAAFHPFTGKLDATPGIGIDGAIRIDFGSEGVRGRSSEYTAWFSLNPRTFSPEWFRKTLVDARASKWGDGVKMELDEGSGFASPFYFSINYVPSGNSERPSNEDAKKLFQRILGILDTWLE